MKSYTRFKIIQKAL